jgi:hypothetical protein
LTSTIVGFQAPATALQRLIAAIVPAANIRTRASTAIVGVNKEMIYIANADTIATLGGGILSSSASILFASRNRHIRAKFSIYACDLIGRHLFKR